MGKRSGVAETGDEIAKPTLRPSSYGAGNSAAPSFSAHPGMPSLSGVGPE